MRAIAAALALTAVAAAGCKVPNDTATPPTSGGTGPAHSSAAKHTAAARVKVSGACDYDLGETMGSDYHVTAEVVAKNTGDAAAMVKVTVTWPQFGTDPITASKKVNIGAGQKATVRFNRHASQNEIDRLQSWQQHHDMADGCTYRGTVVPEPSKSAG